MSQNYMSAKRVDLTANTAVQLYAAYDGRDFLYIRAPDTATVCIRFVSSGDASTSGFRLEPGKVIEWRAPGFVPKERISIIADDDCTVYAMSDMPTV